MKKSFSSTPSGLLKKQARCRIRPRPPRRFSRSASRARSIASGAASRLSHPCQVNWRVIFVPRNPWKWMWSQAVFQSPMSGRYSIVTSVEGL